MPRVTLKDVSKLAGVSPTTASLVLRDSSEIPEATKVRVREAMAALGYVYNRQAASFRSRRSHAIGLVLTEISNPYFAELSMAFEQRLFEAGYIVFICYTREDPQRQAVQIQRLQERGVDGLAVLPAGGTQPQELTGPAGRVGAPVVLFARHLGADDDYVGADNVSAGRLLGQHLVGIGVRTVAFIGGPARSSAADERMQGLEAGLAAASSRLEPAQRMPCATTAAAGAGVTAALLEDGHLPDAIVAYSDVIANGVYAELHARGVQPGRDVAVASFDDIPGSEQQVPPLTTVATFPQQVGVLCADALLSRIDEPDAEPSPIRRLVEPRLRIRASTAAWTHRR